MSPDPLSATLSALADPTRRAILARLALGVSSVTELAKPFEMTLPAVSKHLKVLESAGLIAREREAQWRPCRLRPDPLKEVAHWIGSYRRFWEESLDRLDDYLLSHQAEKKHKKKKKKKHGRKKDKARRRDQDNLEGRLAKEAPGADKPLVLTSTPDATQPPDPRLVGAVQSKEQIDGRHR